MISLRIPSRSGRLVFTGRGDEPLLKLRALIRREELARLPIVGRVPQAFDVHPEIVKRVERQS